MKWNITYFENDFFTSNEHIQTIEIENKATFYRFIKDLTQFANKEIIDDIKIFSLKLIQGKLSEKIDNIIYKYYTGDTAAVLSAILTGNTHHFSEEYDKLLDATAFKRVFHPAYIHIMIVTFLISLLSR